MLQNYMRICKKIKLLEFCNQASPCGHDIANEMISYMSRSTTYRKLYEMKMKGLLDSAIAGHKIVWKVTDRGEEFLGGWNELPF